MDDRMLALYFKYREAMKVLNRGNITGFVESEYYQPMRLYLNVHELMQAASRRAFFDGDICKGYWVAELSRACVECRKLLEHMAADPNEKLT
jgi:hypothetical protein